MKLTAIIEAEGNGYVYLCPQLDIAAKGKLLNRLGTISGKRRSCFSNPHLPRR